MKLINKIFAIIFISSTLMLMTTVIGMALRIIICEAINSRVDIDFLLSMKDFILTSIVVSLISLLIYSITKITELWQEI